MKTIDIYYCIDRNYEALTLNSIESILTLFDNSKYKLKFHLISRDSLIINHKNIQVYQYDEYKQLSTPQLRVLGPSLIKADRLLYLDSDTESLKCISTLWEQELYTQPVGGCQHYCLNTGKIASDYYKLLPSEMNEIGVYLNTGVMLIDCDNWKRHNITHKCIEIFKQYKNHGQRFNDEPGINISLNNNWVKFSEKWNYFPRKQYTRPYLMHYYGQSYIQKPKNPYF